MRPSASRSGLPRERRCTRQPSRPISPRRVARCATPRQTSTTHWPEAMSTGADAASHARRSRSRGPRREGDLPSGRRVGGREHGGRDRRSRDVGTARRCAGRDRAPRREHDGLDDRSSRRSLWRVRVGRSSPRRRRGVGPGQDHCRARGLLPSSCCGSGRAQSCGGTRRHIPRPTLVSPRLRSRPRSTCVSAVRTATRDRVELRPVLGDGRPPERARHPARDRLSRDVTIALVAVARRRRHRPDGAAVIPAPGAHGGDGPAIARALGHRPGSRRSTCRCR